MTGIFLCGAVQQFYVPPCTCLSTQIQPVVPPTDSNKTRFKTASARSTGNVGSTNA